MTREALHHGPRDEWVIELFRGLAALMVVAAHYVPHWQNSVGLPTVWMFGFVHTGVDLFFVLTGYVFAPLLMAGQFALAPYALRRFFRLCPLYFVALAAYVALAAHEGRPIKYLGEHIFFLHTVQNTQIASYYNFAFWSLPPEIEYYLLLPLLAWALRGRLQWLWPLGAITLVTHILTRHEIDVMVAQPSLTAVLGFHLPGLLFEFLLGVLAWKLSRLPLARHGHAALVAAGIVCWLVAAYLFGRSAAGPGKSGIEGLAHTLNGHYGVLAALTYMLLVAGGAALCRGRAGAWARIGAFAGSLSYGTYLFHNAWPQLLAPVHGKLGTVSFLLVCTLATLITAYVLHRLVEAPLRNFGRRLALGLRPAAAA